MKLRTKNTEIQKYIVETILVPQFTFSIENTSPFTEGRLQTWLRCLVGDRGGRGDILFGMVTVKIRFPNLDIRQEWWVLCTFCSPPIPDAWQSRCIAGRRSNEPHFMRGFQSRYLHSQAQIVAAPYRGEYRAGYNVTHCPRRLDLRSEIGTPCATDLLLSPLHILPSLTTADDTIAAKISICSSWLWFGSVALRHSSHVLRRNPRTAHQPPEPQPDMASRFSNQWICLLQNILVASVLLP